MSDPISKDVAELFGLVVHDLRNPSATVGANLAYVRDVLRDQVPDDVNEALDDVDAALGQLMLGLEQLAWIGRWLGGSPPLSPVDGDVAETLRGFEGERQGLRISCRVVGGPLPAAGGASLARVLDVLLANAVQHARQGSVRIEAFRSGQAVVVEWHDEGPAIDPADRERALTLPGQHALKTKANGRYGRVAGLLAARVAVEGFGGALEADGRPGDAVFRLRLPAL